MNEKKVDLSKWKQVSVFIYETLYNLVFVLVIVVVIRTFLVSPFHVSGQSMVPTLQHNDYIIIDKLSFLLRSPQFNDVVVFTPPTPRMRPVTGLHCLVAKASAFSLSDDSCILADFFIKRVIGQPGDIIEIKDGDVFRNGKILNEKYLSVDNNHQTWVPEIKQYQKYVVPEGRFFVLGDNRNGSSDSRSKAKEWRSNEGEYDPYVFQKDIEGRLLFTLLSPSKIMLIMDKNIN